MSTAAVLRAAGLGPASVRADTLAEIETLHKQGQTEQALQQADTAIAQQPRAAQIRFLKGVMLGDLGRNSEAIDVYVSLTQDFPELADPYNNLAVLYAADGHLDGALQRCRLRCATTRSTSQRARTSATSTWRWRCRPGHGRVTEAGRGCQVAAQAEAGESITPPSTLKDSSRRRR